MVFCLRVFESQFRNLAEIVEFQFWCRLKRFSDVQQVKKRSKKWALLYLSSDKKWQQYYSQFYPISLHRNDMFWVGWVFWPRANAARSWFFFSAIIRSGWHVKSQIRISSLSSCILYFGLKIGCGFLVMGLFFLHIYCPFFSKCSIKSEPNKVFFVNFGKKFWV